MKNRIITGLKFLIFFTILTGIIYPLIVTSVAGIFFSGKARGSLVEINGRIAGSELIGQKFDSIKYFSSRPSAIDYNTQPSGGSNLGLMNPVLKEEIIRRKTDFAARNNLQNKIQIIPPEMICASASGLDPHISPESAMMQADRVAKARGMNSRQKEKLINLIKSMTENREFSILGEPRINVFLLNLKTDSLK